MWSDLGIDVEIQQQEWAQFLEALGPPPAKSTDAYRLGWIGDFVDAFNFLELWTCDSGNNNSNFCNKDYDALVAEARNTPDDAERYDLYAQMEQILFGPDGDVPIIPIYFYTNVSLQNLSIKDTFSQDLLDQIDLTKVVEGDGAGAVVWGCGGPAAGAAGRPPLGLAPTGRSPPQMTTFVVRRLVWTVPVILLVILLTFLLMRQIEGNPFRTSERAIPESIQQNLEEKYGLDDPWYVQYLRYVKGVFTLDLGPSLVLRNRDVNDIVREHFPPSLQLGALAMLFALVVGVPLGMLSALRANTFFDYGAMFVSNVGFAIPSFLVATLLIYFFALEWGDIFGLPTSGWDTWQSKVLPTIALGLGPMAYFARLTRGSMLETMQQDYIRTARAKGLRWRRVVVVHTLRNSLIPVVTAAGPILGFLITGSFIIEQIFAIPGIGRYYVTAVTGRDYSVVMGLTVLLALIVIVANLVVDILYGFLDPRTRDART
jgi:oligopeptide transport system permease protein